MFWGPGGVGKRLAALEMAKAVNCAKGTGDACDTCLSCRKVASGNHPDVKIVAPVKKSRIINVETIEGVNEFAALRAYESKWRVFVILDADRMGLEAQNHFLKTLEEPPGASLFLLVTEYPRRLLPTIRSRCQMLRFGALRPETVVDLLQAQRDLPLEVARSVAAVAQGQMSRALDLVDSEKRDIVIEIARRLSENDDPMALAEEFSKGLEARREQLAAAVKAETDTEASEDASRDDKKRLKEEQLALVDELSRREILDYLYLFETWYRDELVFQAAGNDHQILNQDHAARIRQAKPSDAGKKIRAVEQARVYLERFINEERVFRDLFFSLAE
ncbi:MAG: DNA polymerase III subunit delta' [Candidatus Hydrogenedentes bacterium]|nr:DNA polymerase III subunit delta' [Candidatus Hydrogenedentota bacterium]